MLPQLLPVDTHFVQEDETEMKCSEKCCNENGNWKRWFHVCVISTRSIEINGYLLTVNELNTQYTGQNESLNRSLVTDVGTCA